jgi:hypothetical protein
MGAEMADASRSRMILAIWGTKLAMEQSAAPAPTAVINRSRTPRLRLLLGRAAVIAVLGLNPRRSRPSYLS